MAFKKGYRTGNLWKDAEKLNELIINFPFNTTGKTERDFENGFAISLMNNKSAYNSEIRTQVDKNAKVPSVYCFGKKHRPDIALVHDKIPDIALELKFITYAGLKDAIRQGHLYRLDYKFVFLILVISEERKIIYEDIEKGEEKNLIELLEYLAEHMKIFTYVVPAFNLKPGIRKCVEFFL